MSNDTVMIGLQKDTYGRGFNLESVRSHDANAVVVTRSFTGDNP